MKNLRIVDGWKWLKLALQKGLENILSQGKVSEKSGSFEMDIEWQPCKVIILIRYVLPNVRMAKFSGDPLYWIPINILKPISQKLLS